MANLSKDSNFIQLDNSSIEMEDIVRKIKLFELKVFVLSLRPSVAVRLLCRAHERNLLWPKFVWIVHSVDISAETCGGVSMEGVISVQISNTSFSKMSAGGTPLMQMNYESLKKGFSIDIFVIHFCQLSVRDTMYSVFVFQQVKGENIGINVTDVNGRTSFPSDHPPHPFVPFVVLYFIGTTICFLLVTSSLALYIHFRNEPAVKATSVSLSILMYVGNYLTILYLYVLDLSLLPNFYQQDVRLQDATCILFSFLSGIGIPVALILSTLLVKLLRVYQIFHAHRKLNKLIYRNSSMALYVLLITAPNALISIIWMARDPFRSVLISSIENGLLVVSVNCVSKNRAIWTVLLLFYTGVLSGVLLVFAILTRKIKYKHFKDTKKVSMLSFLLVFTGVTGLSYWYLYSVQNDPLPLYSVLQIGHYCFILKCQGFLFAPKLFPIIKEKVSRWYFKVSDAPTQKTYSKMVSHDL